MQTESPAADEAACPPLTEAAWLQNIDASFAPNAYNARREFAMLATIRSKSIEPVPNQPAPRSQSAAAHPKTAPEAAPKASSERGRSRHASRRNPATAAQRTFLNQLRAENGLAPFADASFDRAAISAASASAMIQKLLAPESAPQRGNRDHRSGGRTSTKT